MVEPLVVSRSEHTISRRDIDPDALKVLYRLKSVGYTAYLVGGSVRDLLLGRHPKDFDIGTSAHPYEIKRIFRNCWIIGRRFRLAHVKFGDKVIEVATFRRQIEPGPPPDPDAPAAHLIHHDNTFGTPEQDAFRRDFTLNALFYDIATFSVIDYVGGLQDLRARVVRSIGDPRVRFREDPVRMLRAIALAARLDFTIDPPTLNAIARHRAEIARSAPARLLEELYKILRAGASEKTMRALREVGLLEFVAPELDRALAAGEWVWQPFRALDQYRRRFAAVPDTFTNAVLLGTVIRPLGATLADATRRTWAEPPGADPAETPDATAPGHDPEHPRKPRLVLGNLPLARRDLERLGQIQMSLRRLRDVGAPPRARHALMRRTVFAEALAWLEIHGSPGDRAAVADWQRFAAATNAPLAPHKDAAAPGGFGRRRRRRRRSRRSRPPKLPTS